MPAKSQYQKQKEYVRDLEQKLRIAEARLTVLNHQPGVTGSNGMMPFNPFQANGVGIGYEIRFIPISYQAPDVSTLVTMANLNPQSAPTRAQSDSPQDSVGSTTGRLRPRCLDDDLDRRRYSSTIGPDAPSTTRNHLTSTSLPKKKPGRKPKVKFQVVRVRGRCRLCREYGHNRLTCRKSKLLARTNNRKEIDNDEESEVPVVHGEDCECDACYEEFSRD